MSILDSSVDISPLLLGAIAVLMFLFAIALVIYRSHYRINMFWGLLAIFFGGCGILLTAVGVSAGTVYAKPTGNPYTSVSTFFDAVVTGDYTTVYSLMRDHSDLGLENQPDTEAGQLVMEALKESYDYKFIDDCKVDMLTATQRVTMRYLDVDSLTADLGDATEEKLKLIVQSRDHSLVYDDNEQYRSDVTDEAYIAALKQLLKSPKDYYKQIEFDVTMEYTGGIWQIATAPELLTALSGGTIS